VTETSEQRSKRQYLDSHRSRQWQYKHTIFYAYPEHSTGLLEDMVKFKQLLRRKCPNQPFLVRIQTRQLPEKPLQAFLVLYTTTKVENLQQIADKTFPHETNVLGQSLPLWKLDSSARSIEQQRPHNLNKFFGKTAVKRWSLINKDLIDISLRYRGVERTTAHPDIIPYTTAEDVSHG